MWGFLSIILFLQNCHFCIVWITKKRHFCFHYYAIILCWIVQTAQQLSALRDLQHVTGNISGSKSSIGTNDPYYFLTKDCTLAEYDIRENELQESINKLATHVVDRLCPFVSTWKYLPWPSNSFVLLFISIPLFKVILNCMHYLKWIHINSTTIHKDWNAI